MPGGAAAGGVGTKHNIPYYRIPKRGESGCTPAPVDRSTVFQLTAVGYGGPPPYPFVGYAAAGFVEDGAPAVGDLQPRQYAGRTIVMLSACPWWAFWPTSWNNVRCLIHGAGGGRI